MSTQKGTGERPSQEIDKQTKNVLNVQKNSSNAKRSNTEIQKGDQLHRKEKNDFSIQYNPESYEQTETGQNETQNTEGEGEYAEGEYAEGEGEYAEGEYAEGEGEGEY